jgi:hypothetical protein
MALQANTPKDFTVGQRVRSAAHTDRFMRGIRFGDVIAIGRFNVTVKFDVLTKPTVVDPDSIIDAE